MDTTSAEIVTAVTSGSTDAGFLPAGGPSWLSAAIPWTNVAVDSRTRMESDEDLREVIESAAAQAQILESVVGVAVKPVSVLAIGDSITTGVHSYDGLGWRSTLARMLRGEHVDTGGTIPFIGTGGLTLRGIAPMVPTTWPASRPTIVTILIGTNDAAQPDDAMPDWQNRYAALVDQVLGWDPSVRVVCGRVMLSVAPWSGGEVSINSAVDAVVAARSGRVTSADFTQLDAHALAGSDGVHPTDLGYTLMAQLWFKAIWPWLP